MKNKTLTTVAVISEKKEDRTSVDVHEFLFEIQSCINIVCKLIGMFECVTNTDPDAG